MIAVNEGRSGGWFGFESKENKIMEKKEEEEEEEKAAMVNPSSVRSSMPMTPISAPPTTTTTMMMIIIMMMFPLSGAAISMLMVPAPMTSVDNNDPSLCDSTFEDRVDNNHIVDVNVDYNAQYC